MNRPPTIIRKNYTRYELLEVLSADVLVRRGWVEAVAEERRVSILTTLNQADEIVGLRVEVTLPTNQGDQ